VSAPVDRVLKLLALAADGAASEAEARTAAFQAAKLIKEHAIAVGTSPCASATQKALTVVLLDELEAAERRIKTLEAQLARSRQSASVEAPKFIRIAARFPGWCRACRDEIPVGADADWLKGTGMWHPSCRGAS
jgi:hypothetical protein